MFMLLLHLFLSFSFYSNPGPRTTRSPSCHFLGLYESASSFSQQRKRSSRLRFVALADPHIPKWKQKARPLQKKCHQHIIPYATPGGWRKRGRKRGEEEVRQLQDVRPFCQPLAGRGGGEEGFLSFRLAPVSKYNQHVGLFRLFSTSCMMMELLSNSPLKHKVSGSERETPTFISTRTGFLGDTMSRHTT